MLKVRRINVQIMNKFKCLDQLDLYKPNFQVSGLWGLDWKAIACPVGAAKIQYMMNSNRSDTFLYLKAL